MVGIIFSANSSVTADTRPYYIAKVMSEILFNKETNSNSASSINQSIKSIPCKKAQNSKFLDSFIYFNMCNFLCKGCKIPFDSQYEKFDFLYFMPLKNNFMPVVAAANFHKQLLFSVILLPTQF